jgi:hypothetical protein
MPDAVPSFVRAEAFDRAGRHVGSASLTPSGWRANRDGQEVGVMCDDRTEVETWLRAAGAVCFQWWGPPRPDA